MSKTISIEIKKDSRASKYHQRMPRCGGSAVKHAAMSDISDSGERTGYLGSEYLVMQSNEILEEAEMNYYYN